MRWINYLKPIGVFTLFGGSALPYLITGNGLWVSVPMIIGGVYVEWLRKEKAIALANIEKEKFLQAIGNAKCAEVHSTSDTSEVTYKAKK